MPNQNNLRFTITEKTIIVGFFIVKILLHPEYGYHSDELYYIM